MRSTVELIVNSNEINVKSFGVKGDGITDDTDNIESALNSAIEKGKTLFFPNGTYLIRKTFRPNTEKLVSIRGESHLGVVFKKYGVGDEFGFIFDFQDCKKVYAVNLSSPYGSFNTLRNESYTEGVEKWALELRDKDFYLENLVYTGTGGNQSYYKYINAPAPKNYERYADGNYAKYPLEITNCGGYNAININNFSTNSDGTIGSPQDNSAIGIVDRTTNSTGVLFIDMLGNRSFERYVNRNAEISSEIRPLTVWEISPGGHLAIGCSTDVNDPVARGWETMKIRDNSPSIALYDVNNSNRKATIQYFNDNNIDTLSFKINGYGFDYQYNPTNGQLNFRNFRNIPIDGGFKIKSNSPNESLIFEKNNSELSFYLDNDLEMRVGNPTQAITEGARLLYVMSGNTGSRPTFLSSHWRDKGYQYFDTTLNKPIWWNGTNWVDANGVTV